MGCPAQFCKAFNSRNFHFKTAVNFGNRKRCLAPDGCYRSQEKWWREVDLLKNFDFMGIEKIVIETHPGIVGVERILELRERFISLGFSMISENSKSGVWYLSRNGSAKDRPL